MSIEHQRRTNGETFSQALSIERQVVGKLFRMSINRHKETIFPTQTFESAAVMGGTGKIGRLWIDRIVKTRPNLPLTGVIRHFDKRVEPFPTVGFTDDISTVLREQKPEALVVATANQDNDAVLQSIRDNITEQTPPLTLILVQNGFEVSEKAKQLFKGTNVTLVRALIFTPVSENEDGTIKYNEKKLRAGIAVIPGEPGNRTQELDSLRKTAALLRQGGFKLKIAKDYRKLELAKAELNAIGTTGEVTQLSPSETFKDQKLRGLEINGIARRREGIEKNGEKPITIFWGGAWTIPAFKNRLFRTLVNHYPYAPILSRMITKGREDKPPSTVERLRAGATIDRTEVRQYHEPFIKMAEQAGLEAKTDAAIVKTIERHPKEFNLNTMTPKDRKRILLAAAGENGFLANTVKRLTESNRFGKDWFGKLAKDFLLKTVRIEVVNPENLETVKRLSKEHGFIIISAHVGALDIAAYGKALLPVVTHPEKSYVFVADTHINPERNPVEAAIMGAWGRIMGTKFLRMFQTNDTFANNSTKRRANYDSVMTGVAATAEPESFIDIMPEGRRNRKALSEAEPGVEHILEQAVDSVMILPIAAHHGRIIPFLTKTKIVVGEPYLCKDVVEKSKQTKIPLVKLVMDNLAALLPKNERGPYGNIDQAA